MYHYFHHQTTYQREKIITQKEYVKISKNALNLLNFYINLQILKEKTLWNTMKSALLLAT